MCKIFIAVLVLVTLICCGDRQRYYIPAGAKEGDLKLEPFVYKTDSISYSADRGTLIVRENSIKNNSRMIALPVKIIHSQASSPAEPVFYLAGGPGQSNMKFKPSDELLKNHDFVLVGYRGVDGSAVLKCPEVSKAIKGVGNDILSDSSLVNLNRAFKDCACRLQKEGLDLDAYTMIDVIRDLEVARKALLYSKIHLLSQSYGTRIAQIYAYQHPETIKRSVMIGVNPPGHFIWDPDTIDSQIRYYARLWKKDSDCTTRSPDIERTMRNVINNMPRRWLFLPVNKGKVKIITFSLLYHRKTAAMVFDTYVKAEKGDPSGLALMTLAYDFMLPKMITWGDLASKAYSADFEKDRNYALEMDPPGAIIGSPFSKLLWSLSDWTTSQIPQEFRNVQQSEVETLLLSGSIDFSTPAGFATHELLPFLTNGKQIILYEMGHTGDIWKVQRAKTLKVISDFYDTGNADKSLFTYSPMDFKVKWGFPLIAKALSGGVLLILIGLVVLMYRFAKRIK